jgi:AmmeMemoRadiSam system protein A
VARKRDLPVKLLAACNSGDTAGGKDRVVGYSAFAAHEGGGVSLKAAGSMLLSIARGAIEKTLLQKTEPAFDLPWLKQAGATFVTLSKNGALRGCIGSLSAARPLGEDVAENARAAAFRDPRFPALTREEWPQCKVEVSLLTAPKPLRLPTRPISSQISRARTG